jgi:hypothetical protein
MSWGAVIAHVGTSYLQMDAAYEQSKLIEINSKLNQTMAGIEADQMLRQATSMENQGVRQAQIEQYKTRSTMSDATAQMSASGAELDPFMLAKIQQRGNYNSMSALFDARSKAIDMRMNAGMVRIGADWDASEAKRTGRAGIREATTGVIMNSLDKFWPASSAQKTGKYTGSKARPKGYTANVNALNTVGR